VSIKTILPTISKPMTRSNASSIRGSDQKGRYDKKAPLDSSRPHRLLFRFTSAVRADRCGEYLMKATLVIVGNDKDHQQAQALID
jgi:hypothetical protein